MNFSRFFKYLLPFFLLPALANSARPIDFKYSAFNFGKPLFFEIPRIPQASPYSYKSILIDKGNRLFITKEQDVFIYDGIHFQQIKVPGNPVIAYDGRDRVAIAGNRYLSILTLTQSGEYRAQQPIDSSTIEFKHQITSIGFGVDKKVYFSTGSKLWVLKEKPTPIDSSDQKITGYSTQQGLIFYSDSKGFYGIEGNTFNRLSKRDSLTADGILSVLEVGGNLIAITSHSPWTCSINGNNSAAKEIRGYIKSDEKILWATASGSYFFIATSCHRLLMVDNQGRLINSMADFGNFNSDTPIDICTSDDINFFALTPTQIIRFINPMMIQVFDANENLKGNVKSAKRFGTRLYVTTSYGLYAVTDLEQDYCFELLHKGEFFDLGLYNDQLFATASNGLYLIKGIRADRVTPKSFEFSKTCLVESKSPKAFFLDGQGVFYALLKPPFTLHEVRNENNLPFINFYRSDSLMLLKAANDKWFFCDPESENPSTKECKAHLDSRSSCNQLIAESDTLCIANEHIVRLEKTGITSFIGQTYAHQPITNFYGDAHPNYQTLMISKGDPSHPKAIIAIEKTFRINAAYLEADSSTWISTNQGLIRVSKNYLIHQRPLPRIRLFSCSSIYHGVTTQIYHGYAQWSDVSSTNFRIKQGRSIEMVLSGAGGNGWSNLLYSFKPDGATWSDWATNPAFNLTDLAPGNHSYYFKAKDMHGNESVELMIGLRVIPNFFQTQFTLIALFIFIILSIYTLFRWRSFNHALERFKLEGIINRRTEELVKEKEKTDNLLARVLPRETAKELKDTGKVNNQKFNMATVLFSDIQGFTKITDELNPENLIDQLDKFFLYFDAVVDKYRIEKIKTIGDAYMCAGGIPHKNRTNPIEVVLAALEMMYFMREINLEHNPGQDIWALRIGIDTGPVIAGVVGRNKLSYDIWGSTVNTASRMESSGEAGKINISGNTHVLVQDYFICTYRGRMPIKNKGDIEMYFVEGIKPFLSNTFDIYRPNSEFELQLQFLRFGDLEEFILEKLEKGLPKNLYYHNLKHTVDVYTQVELIGRSEDVSQEEQLMLQTAALLHDAGHLIDYDTHEEMGVKLAREILPDYQYTERQIEIISDLILITKLPPKPKNLLEAIMCDADLDYLGRTDFIPVSNMLYKELHEHGRIGSIQEWNEIQIKFIEKHQYFTNTARRLRNVNKNSQLDNIKKWIEKNKL